MLLWAKPELLLPSFDLDLLRVEVFFKEEALCRSITRRSVRTWHKVEPATTSLLAIFCLPRAKVALFLSRPVWRASKTPRLFEIKQLGVKGPGLLGRQKLVMV